jgi:hypothetical protein
MCERAIKLKLYIDDWLQKEIALKITSYYGSDSYAGEVDYRDLKRLRLSATEWNHLEMLT